MNFCSISKYFFGVNVFGSSLITFNLCKFFKMVKEAYSLSRSDDEGLRKYFENEFVKKLISSNVIYKITTQMALEDLLIIYPIHKN